MTNFAMALTAVMIVSSSCGMMISAIFHYVNSAPVPPRNIRSNFATTDAPRLILIKR